MNSYDLQVDISWEASLSMRLAGVKLRGISAASGCLSMETEYSQLKRLFLSQVGGSQGRGLRLCYTAGFHEDVSLRLIGRRS